MAEKSVFRGMSPDGIRKMAFELYSHRTEFEAQNEELSRLQKELENLQVKYASVHDSAPVGYFTFDRDGLILEVNRTAALQMNMERDGLVKEPFFQYVARDFLEVFTLHCGKVFESGKSEAFETRLARKDGSEFPARIECIPVPDSAGIITKCRAAVIDFCGCGLSKETKTEPETGRVFFDEADDAFFLHDANNGNVLDVNRKALELFGYSREEAMSLSFGALNTVETLYTEEDALGLIRKAAGGEPLAVEWMARDKSGRKFWAKVNLKRMVVQNKDCVLAVVCDITERRQGEDDLRRNREHLERMVEERTSELRRANRELERVIAGYIQSEDSLRKSDDKYRKLVEAASDAIFVTDAESGIILDVNRRAVELSGVPRKELVGMHQSMLYPEEGRAYYSESLSKAAAEGGATSLELIFRSRNGRMVLVEANASVVEIDGRKVLQGIFRDVTKRRKLNGDLPGAGNINSAGIGEADVAHDINNSLTAVLNNIFLAKSLVTSDTKACDRLKAAENASLRARQLMQRFVAYREGGTLTRKQTSLQGLIEETVELALCGTTAACDYSIPEDLWPVAIDEAQISQVISNVVTEADHAMPEDGTIQVRAENTVLKEGEVPPLMEGRYVRVDVGVQGMDGQNRDRISEPCGTTSEKDSGTGLADVYTIVENHGGHIRMAEGQEGGYVFHVYLPAVSERAFVDDNNSAPRGTEGGSLKSS